MVSILNPAAIDALCSAAYLEHYLDCVDDLPADLQRCVSVLRELDCLANDALADVKKHYEIWQVGDGMTDSSVILSEKRRLAVTQLQRSLGRMQEIGDQKLATVAEIIEQVESKTRELEQNVDNLANVGVIKEEEASSGNVALPAQSRQTTCTTSGNTSNSSGVLESASVSASPATGKPLKIEEKLDIAVAVKSGKRQKRTRNMQDTAAFDKEEKKNEDEEKVSLRKKKAKKERGDNHSPVNSKLHIDPNEPTYCLCQQVSYGEMIGCDNEQCPIEWFHFDCVRLTHKPKGKWYCPRCRGTRPNVMNPELLNEQSKRLDKSACSK